MFMTRCFWCMCLLVSTIVFGWTSQNLHAGEGEIAIDIVDTVRVRVPNVWAVPGDTLAVPVIIHDDVTGLGILSVTLNFTFDPSFIALVADTVSLEGTFSEGWYWFFYTGMRDTTTLAMAWAE